jgi:hypothetical protein
LNLTFTYELPFGSGKRFLSKVSPAVNQLVRGWSVSGVQTYQSGTVIDISTPASIPTYGPIWALQNPSGGAIRTSVGCGDYDQGDPSLNRYLNVNAFVSPPLLTLGDTKILPNVRTCGWYDESFSILKRTTIRERYAVRFGADFINAFNRHVWTGLQTNIGNPQAFGRYTGASNPRIIQIHLTVDF